MEHIAIYKLSKTQPSLLSKVSDRLCCGDMDSAVFFYHSGHLGSASWITNGSGTPIQHLQYMPYGEPFVNERTTGYEERFCSPLLHYCKAYRANSCGNAIAKPLAFYCSPLLCYRFVSTTLTAQIPNGNAIAKPQALLHTGKERDSETGFSCFGARYYDSDILTAWLSVDPMADKYPSMSPYAYCGWNPVKLVDPDGEEIWIFGENEKIKYSIGMSSKDLSGFSKLTVDALNSIYSSSDEGAELISSLTSSDNIFNIKRQTPNDVSKFTPESSVRASARNNKNILSKWLSCIENGYKTSSGGEILWRSDGYNIQTTEGLRNDPVYHLIHELSHAYDSNIGCMYYNDINYNGLDLDEWSACLRANCIGSYMGFPKQTVYGGEADIHGNYIKGGTKLFDNNGNEINPF